MNLRLKNLWPTATAILVNIALSLHDAAAQAVSTYIQAHPGRAFSILVGGIVVANLAHSPLPQPQQPTTPPPVPQ